MTEHPPTNRTRNSLIGVIYGILIGFVTFGVLYASQFLALVILMVGLAVATVNQQVAYVYALLALLQVPNSWWIGRRHKRGVGRLMLKLFLSSIGLLLLLFILAVIATFFFFESAR